MAAAFLRRAGMSLQASRRDGKIRFMSREVTVWTGGTGTGWSVGTQDFAIPDKLASVVILVELFDGTVLVNG